MAEQNFEQKSDIWKIVLITVVGLLVISNIVTAAFLYSSGRQADDNKAEPDPSINGNLSQDVGIPGDQSTENYGEGVEPLPGKIEIAWSDWLTDVRAWNLFDYEKVRLTQFYEGSQMKQYGYTDASDFFNSYKVYKAGVVSQGVYKDSPLYIVTYAPEGPAFRDNMYRVIKDGDNLVLLSNYSDELGGDFSKLFVINNSVEISNLEPPEIISIPGSGLKLIKGENEPRVLMTKFDSSKRMFKYDGINYLYKDEQKNCFIVRANDGTAREYYYNLDFLGVEQIDRSDFASITPSLLNFNWSDGSKNSYEYSYREVGGCGGYGCYNYVNYVTAADLKEVGKSASGEIFYALQKENLKANPDDEKPLLELMFDIYYPGYDSATNKVKDKISYQQFLAGRPIIYWQDPFGSYIEIRRADYLPAVECGKPVIYLYPQTETDVAVKVEPSGGFTVTEPSYNDGWFVKASPDGQLYNYADQQTYPYLFWEGHGLDYTRPTQGFVVPKQEVETFLIKKLSEMGLIKNEYDEFIVYWLPKMQDRNYYFITFVPQAEFDVLAPLTVSPQPDTVIRVFMDYQGLDKYVKVEPQVIKTPVRKGFTVVEWGGALN